MKFNRLVRRPVVTWIVFNHGLSGSFVELNGDRNVTVLNSDDRKRNLDNDNFENDWHSNYRFLLVRNSFVSTSTPSSF